MNRTNVFRNLTGILLLIIFTTSVADARPQNVALFTDGVYVNMTPTTGEAVREMATLVNKRHVVTSFTGVTGSSFINALTGKTALVIPELSRGDLSASITPAAINAIKAFINSGGVMVVHGESTGGRGSLLLNTIFGWGAAPSAPGLTLDAVVATGTPFNGAAPVLPANNITTGLLSALLPAGTKNIYTNGRNSSVVQIPYGFGHVVFLGWNWFDAAPTGLVDGGWIPMLDAAVNVVSTAPKGAPAPAPVPAPNAASGGGCSINTSSSFDPTMIVMLLLSVAYLVRRHKYSI